LAGLNECVYIVENDKNMLRLLSKFRSLTKSNLISKQNLLKTLNVKEALFVLKIENNI